jgi:hypothetical protein
MRLNADMGEDAERLWDLKAFTDNLVIGHPLRQDGEPELGQFSWTSQRCSSILPGRTSSCAGASPLVRFFMSEDVVFGAGLLDAYDADQQADLPRGRPSCLGRGLFPELLRPGR